MKKIIYIFVFVLSLFFTGSGYAGNLTPFPAQPEPQPVIDLFPISFQGDTLYLPRQGTIAIGVSTVLATAYNSLFELRAEAATTSDKEPLFGLGIGVNIPILFKDVLHFNWSYGVINPSLSVMGVMKLGKKNIIEPAVCLTIIRIPLK